MARCARERACRVDPPCAFERRLRALGARLDRHRPLQRLGPTALVWLALRAVGGASRDLDLPRGALLPRHKLLAGDVFSGCVSVAPLAVGWHWPLDGPPVEMNSSALDAMPLALVPPEIKICPPGSVAATAP